MSVARLGRCAEFFLCSRGDSDRGSARVGDKPADLARGKSLVARFVLEWPADDGISRLAFSICRGGLSSADFSVGQLVGAHGGADHRHDHVFLGHGRHSLVHPQSGLWLDEVFHGEHSVAHTLVVGFADGLLDLKRHRDCSIRLVVSPEDICALGTVPLFAVQILRCLFGDVSLMPGIS